MKTLFLDVSVHSMTMTFVEGVPPSKHFRCITQRYVLRSPITQPNIPEEQVASRRGYARLRRAIRLGYGPSTGTVDLFFFVEIKNSE